MAKKKQSESVATKFTMVLRPRTPTTEKEKVKQKARGKMPLKVNDKAKAKKTVVSGKTKNGNAAKTGNAAKRKHSVDEGNTEVAGSRVKKLKAVMNKNEMDKGAKTVSTRVRRLNSAKKGDQSSKKDFKKESAEAKTRKLKKNILVKKEASLTVRSPNPKKNISVKKEASPAIRSPKPKKNLPAEPSKRITRNGGMSKDPMSKARGKMHAKVDDKAKAKKTVASGKIKNGNSAKTGNAAKRKLSVDEGNTKVAGSRVKKLKAVMNKNEMDKGAETGSTRVLRLNSGKKGDQSRAKTRKLKKKILVKKEASLTVRSPNPKKNISVKKEASPAIRSPKPKKNLPAEASKRIIRKGGMSEDPMSKQRANDTIANKIRTVQGLKNQDTGTNENNEFIRRKKAIVVTDSVFPPEIIMEILSWLPVKFFGTPMVVCKQWYALIQDRHFIEKHMRRNFSFIESNVGQGYMKVYSRDGLRLEMNTSTQKYLIRNPDTKQSLELPDPHKGSYRIIFAYVHLTLNYKIVSIYYDKNNIECCEILSLGNGELSWRLLKMPTEDYLGRNRKKFIMKVIGDVVHCVRVIASEDDMVEEVISLDLGTELFTVTTLPKGQYKSWEKVWLINFKGKPALVDIVGAELCVLVLEDYKKQKWAKKESLIPLELMKKLEVERGKIFPYFVDQFETLWFWAKESRKPISYNFKTKGISSKRVHWHSLVRLKGMQPE